MPQVNKQALSQYIRTGCERQLALNLFPDNAAFRPERNSYKMPYPQSPRPGLRQIQQAGDEWQAEKLHDLTQTFGSGVVLGDAYATPSNQIRYNAIGLKQFLQHANPVCFLIEAQFQVGQAFKNALGIAGHDNRFQLQYAEVRPDIIEVVPAGTFSQCTAPDGTLLSLPNGDARRQLRVIDIKLTARASQSYFAEVTYYSMALAGWLIDQGLDDNFVVAAEGAVWPGSHEASNLVRVSRELLNQGVTPTLAQLRTAMDDDLEGVPFEVFALRVRRFLQVEVPQVLTITQKKAWQTLEWHVDNRCSFCEYLGEDRPPSPHDPHTVPHPDHCLPAAQVQDHLSRVAFISRGARQSLTQAGVRQVGALAQRPAFDPVFELHQSLRATRTVVASRAGALHTQQTSIAPQSGTSASMPRWADLRIYLSVDFDVGSAITVAFGWKASWVEPRAFNSLLTTPRTNRLWQANARLVISRDLDTERRELLAFLGEMHNILAWAQRQDQQNLSQPALASLTPQQRQPYRTKVQFYLWDSLQYEHLTRIIGRHLQAILQRADISYLAWLFPPEDLLPNPEMATRRSPITIVRDVIRSQLAAPVPHYYSLFEIARLYHEPTLLPNIAAFSVHPLFSVPLSDQIPSERAHEIWSQVTTPTHWQQQMATYAETVCKRLNALETVTKRLESDLGSQLSQAAPVINIGPPPRQLRLSIDGQLWCAFAKLDSALEELEVHQVRAMPPHERAAKFRSARLPSRLTGVAEQTALTQMGLSPQPGRRVYTLAADSREVKAKVGDFAFALAPENKAGFLDDKLARVVWNTPLQAPLEAQFGGYFWRVLMEEVLSVSVVGLDRNRGLIALDPSPRYPALISHLHRNGIANFDQDVILDPVHHDFFTDKLLAALRAIGNPPCARNNPLVGRATGQRGQGSKRSPHTPTADFLWNCQSMANCVVSRRIGPVQKQLIAHGLKLNPTQWKAWRDSLTHRARLVWGPPGTGKSHTVRAIVVGAILEAHQAQRPLRVLLAASTYTAIDNVLLDVARDLNKLLGSVCRTYRVRSKYQPPPGNIAPAIDIELDRGSPAQDVSDLQNRLRSAEEQVVVGATPEQVHNLLICNDGSAQAEWFDFIVIDEASQMDVAHAVLPLCGIAEGGSVVLAGDPLQLPPIHQAEAPTGLENLVGPVYSFFEKIHQVPVSALDKNYRSNDTIVEFARQTGYRAALTSHAPNLRINLLPPLPQRIPVHWPASLHWDPAWNLLLDPDQPTVCFVYEDGRSSQRNSFEAEAVTALIYLLHGRLSNQLLNDPAPPPQNWRFWSHGIGVVTPHRAQQGLIISRLQAVFQATGALADEIRDAVDTVERFQGQQRDVIIASYALGDPDQIQEEEEFLMSLNRFNVMASRARAKLIVLVSREVVDHLASEIDILHQSRLLKVFIELFCNRSRQATLGYLQGGNLQRVPGVIRWRG